MSGSASSPARIVVVDDDALFREGAVLSLVAHGYAASAAESVEAGATLLTQHPFDLVILDIQMPGNARLEWLKELARKRARPAVILCTGFPSIDTAIEAVRLPVLSYLIKPVSETRLLAEVAGALARARFAQFPVDAADSLRQRVDGVSERFGLTPRQVEVLELLGAGKNNREIATALACAARTVELHVSELLRRTQTDSRLALVARVWSGFDGDR